MIADKIIERAFNPLFEAKSSLITYKMGYADNVLCGDSCIMYVKIEDRFVTDARHTTDGCTITKACADLLCERMIGNPIDIKINLFTILGVPIKGSRRECVLTPQKAFLEALKR
jgi:NifU-like protein involved in Fe-S cluster formation